MVLVGKVWEELQQEVEVMEEVVLLVMMQAKGIKKKVEIYR